MKNKIFLIADALFFIAFFLYALLAINPVLVFHHQQLGFSSSQYFLQEFLDYPGGIAEYFALFLFQFSSNSIAGALLYTILAILLVILVWFLIPSRIKKFGVILSYLPAVLFAGLIANYSFHLVFIISVLFILSSLNLLKLVTEKQLNAFPYLVISFILFILTYYVTGGFPFLIFSLSAILYLLLEKSTKTTVAAVCLLVLSLIMPWLSSKVLFYITLKDAFMKIIPYYYTYKPGIVWYTLYFCIPVTLFVARLIGMSNKNRDEGASQRKNILLTFQYAVVIIAGIALCYFIFPKEQNHKIRVDYYSYTSQWDKVLTLAKEHPSEDRLIQFHTDRALYHTGKLPEKMFDYPQTMGVDGLFLARFLMPEILIPTAQLLMDMGSINEAIHWGNEAISQNENSPQILEQLILSNIIATNYKSAQLYINNLKSNPLFRKTANRYDQYIHGGNMPEIDSFVRATRKIMPSADFIVQRNSPQLDLINLLYDKDNKMAYEYLQAYFLLMNDVASFVTYFPMTKKYGYQHLPVIYQEALVLYTFELQRRGKDLPKLELDNDVITRFNNYLSVIQSHKGDLQKAKRELERNFGNTYWFYVHYLSPVTTKKQIIVK